MHLSATTQCLQSFAKVQAAGMKDEMMGLIAKAPSARQP
jgi:hypothetical protein